ncbi:MAG: hypothetical protein F7B60_04575 [Desulfurococcales archaeon]|nr:hypothetical protein [Desulfurococcales archaeon]
MKEKIEVKWISGVISIWGVSELTIRGDEWHITLSQRDIKLEGIIGTEEQFLAQGSNLKHLYIRFNEQLRGSNRKSSKQVISSNSRLEIGFFEVRYTVLRGKLFYITTVPIYGALYDYAILTPSELYVRTLGRRKVFIQGGQNNMNVYLL